MLDVEISKPECYVCKRKGPINDFVFLEEYNGHIIERKYQIPLSECVGVRQLMAFSQQFELQTEFPPSDDLLQSQFDLRVSSSSNREKLIGLYMQRGYCVSSGSTSAVRFHMTCEQISEGKFRPPHLAKKNRLIHRTQKIEQPDRIADLSHRACNGCLKLVMGDTGESCTWNVSGEELFLGNKRRGGKVASKHRSHKKHPRIAEQNGCSSCILSVSRNDGSVRIYTTHELNQDIESCPEVQVRAYVGQLSRQLTALQTAGRQKPLAYRRLTCQSLQSAMRAKN